MPRYATSTAAAYKGALVKKAAFAAGGLFAEALKDASRYGADPISNRSH